MRRIYKIADVVMAVETPFDFKECVGFAPYSVDDGTPDVTFRFSYGQPSPCKGQLLFENPLLRVFSEGERIIRDFHIPYDKELCTRVVRSEKEDGIFECICVPKKAFYFAETWNFFNAVGLEWALIEKNRIILHSSHIRVRDRAMLFSAPSGTGKSTQANLWEKAMGAEIINGDRTAIAVTDRGVLAYGLPIAGSSEIFKNVTSTLGAAVVLRQAKENTVTQLKGREAFKWLLSETTISSWIPEFYERATDILFSVAEKVPVYMLYCTPDVGAVDCLNNILTF